MVVEIINMKVEGIKISTFLDNYILETSTHKIIEYEEYLVNNSDTR